MLRVSANPSIALGHDKAQNIIDQITQAYESGGGPPPGGFGFTAASLGGPPPGYGELSILFVTFYSVLTPRQGLLLLPSVVRCSTFQQLSETVVLTMQSCSRLYRTRLRWSSGHDDERTKIYG